MAVNTINDSNHSFKVYGEQPYPWCIQGNSGVYHTLLQLRISWGFDIMQQLPFRQ